MPCSRVDLVSFLLCFAFLEKVEVSWPKSPVLLAFLSTLFLFWLVSYFGNRNAEETTRRNSQVSKDGNQVAGSSYISGLLAKVLSGLETRDKLSTKRITTCST